MIDHDKVVGALLDKLDELGIADNTIVVYSTDNGPHMNTWPDGGMTPFRSEKNTNWEGAFRVPEMIRWPGKIPAGVVSNEIIQHHDWLPTFLAAAGEPDIVEKLKQGHEVGDKTFKVHIDGFNLLPYLTGEVEKSPRQVFVYFSDDGDVLGAAVRQLEGRVHGAAGARERCRSGPSRSWRCGSRSCSTSAPTRSSGPTSPRTRTRTGSSTTPTSSLAATVARDAVPARRSRSSRRARRRRASRSTRRWPSSRRRSPPANRTMSTASRQSARRRHGRGSPPARSGWARMPTIPRRRRYATSASTASGSTGARRRTASSPQFVRRHRLRHRGRAAARPRRLSRERPPRTSSPARSSSR